MTVALASLDRISILATFSCARLHSKEFVEEVPANQQCNAILGCLSSSWLTHWEASCVLLLFILHDDINYFPGPLISLILTASSTSGMSVS